MIYLNIVLESSLFFIYSIFSLFFSVSLLFEAIQLFQWKGPFRYLSQLNKLEFVCFSIAVCI